tara:strand:+ start:2350 stop:3255 length:906 start_codon:yes stop_codon:yes gene_type:complete
MKNLNDLTVIIVTYRTPENIILDCLKSINSNIKVLVVENSENFIHEEFIKSKFSNVEIKCSGKNLGYGGGNNFGLNQIKTNYALILNPDVICEKNFFNNLSEIINENYDFTIIGCQYSNDKVFMPAGFFNEKKNNKFRDDFKNNNLDKLHKVEWVTGCSMLINLKKFNTKEIFDENFFLYFEEIDLCKSLIKEEGNVFTSRKLKIHHLGFKSSVSIDDAEKDDINHVREWHWMWSSFYFYKKNYSYIYAFYKMFGKLIKSILRLSLYSITLQKNKKDKYLFRFLGLINSILNRPSFFRKKD